MPSNNERLIAAGRRLVTRGASAGAVVRLVGGGAVLLHRHLGLGVDRGINDLDIIISQRSRHVMAMVAACEEFEPDKRFNALHGSERMLFNGPLGRLDVFVGSFEMCHRIPLENRLELDPFTISVSDLLLTKLQVVAMTEKDATDVITLLGNHSIVSEEGDSVSLGHLGAVLGSDWGLWRTTTSSLNRLSQLSLDSDVAAKVAELSTWIANCPKTRSFSLRAKIGERKRWYKLPEDVL